MIHKEPLNSEAEEADGSKVECLIAADTENQSSEVS
jgi:hypothetical protein